MNLIEEKELAKIVAKKSPIATERKQQLVDHIRDARPENRAALVHQLLGAMKPEEVAFLKEILGLDPASDTPGEYTLKAGAAQAVIDASKN